MRVVRTLPRGRLVIDRAQASDGDGVLELYLSVLAEERWFIASPDELLLDGEAQGSHIAWLNRQDNGVFLVARLGGELVGALKITGGDLRRTRHVGRLEVWVGARWREAGVGLALLEAGIRWAEECPRLSKLSLCVFDDNPRAIHLYERLGFAVEGRRHDEYRERDGRTRGDVLMARSV